MPPSLTRPSAYQLCAWTLIGFSTADSGGRFRILRFVISDTEAEAFAMGRATSPLSDNWHREVDAALVACFSLALTLSLSRSLQCSWLIGECWDLLTVRKDLLCS